MDAGNGVDISVLYTLHDAYMVGTSVLSVRVRIIPIKEDDVARSRLVAAILPQSALLEPCRTGRTPCKHRDDAVLRLRCI